MVRVAGLEPVQGCPHKNLNVESNTSAVCVRLTWNAFEILYLQGLSAHFCVFPLWHKEIRFLHVFRIFGRHPVEVGVLESVSNNQKDSLFRVSGTLFCCHYYIPPVDKNQVDF